MTPGSLDSDNEAWLPARTDEVSPTAPGPQQKLPGGARLGTWLLWLCFGLPGSAALFVLVPGFLGVWAAELLDKSDVPLEVWSEFEGGTARELAGLHQIGQEAAKKQRQRAQMRLKTAFRRECMD